MDIKGRHLLLLAVFAGLIVLAWMLGHRGPRPALESVAPVEALLPEPTPAPQVRERRARHPWHFAFIPKFKRLGETGSLSSYWQPAWEGAQQAAADFGVRIDLVTSPVRGVTDQDYVEPQIRLVAELVARGHLDGLIIAPFDSNRLAPVVDRAIAAGIPAVALDTPVNSERVLAFVSFDNFTAGRVLGAWLVRQLGGRGKVLVLDGPPDQQNAVERRRGFLAGLRTGNVDILSLKRADWEIEPARLITLGWLRKYPEVNAIVAANDNMALGAAQAVAAMGRQHILITGFDATEAGLAAIATGRLAATIDQSPEAQSRLAIQLLIHRLEQGERYPACVFLNRTPLVTRDNLDEYRSGRGVRQP